MANTIKTIIEDEYINFNIQIKLCETIILSLSKEQLNECCIKHSHTTKTVNVIDISLSLLMYLVMNKRYECLINFLLINRKDDIDINLTEFSNGWSALFFAVRFSNIHSSDNIVKILIDAGSNINILDSRKWSLLHVSMSNDESSDYTAQILINAGIDINAQNDNGSTPLMTLFHYCLINERIMNKMMTLIRAKTIVNLQNKYGRTALMCAVQNISPDDPNINDIIMALLEAGADVNINDNYGKIAFNYVKPIAFNYIKPIIKDLLIDAISKTQHAKEREQFKALKQEFTAEREKSAAFEQELIAEREKSAAFEQKLTAEREKSAVLKRKLITEKKKFEAPKQELMVEREKHNTLSKKKKIN